MLGTASNKTSCSVTGRRASQPLTTSDLAAPNSFSRCLWFRLRDENVHVIVLSICIGKVKTPEVGRKFSFTSGVEISEMAHKMFWRIKRAWLSASRAIPFAYSRPVRLWWAAWSWSHASFAIHCESYMISPIIAGQSRKIMWPGGLGYLTLSPTCWSSEDTYMSLILMQWTRKLEVTERTGKVAGNVFRCREATALLVRLLDFLRTSDGIPELTSTFRCPIKFSPKPHRQPSRSWWLQTRL